MMQRRFFWVLIAILLLGGMTGIVAGYPNAQFTASTVKGPVPLTVQFTDQSTSSGTTIYKWDINNDGIIDYTTKDATHTYTKTGTYSVKHIVRDPSGRDVELKTDYITVTTAPVAPVAAFTSDKQSGYAPLTVQFTDRSTGTTPRTYAWDFDSNGVTDSTTRSPLFTFSAPGTYSVTLTVTNIAGTKSITKIGYITVTQAPVPPQAAFSSDVQSGYAPLKVTFTDQSVSSGTTTYKWDVTNDGTTDYTTQNPVHTYRTAGIYTVKLTVTNAAGSDIERKSGYITVTNAPPVPVAPVAAFTSDKQSGTAPLNVQFTDQSTGTAPLTYAWDFDNDGVTDSSLKSPLFAYQSPGTYSVKLTVTNPVDTSSVTRSDYITVTTAPVLPQADFTSDVQSGYAPMTVHFTDTSIATGTPTYRWDINNDGRTDYTVRNPVHTYSGVGTYTVKLTVTNAAGSDIERKTGYITVTTAPQPPVAVFTASPRSGSTPLTVTFTDQSTGTGPLTYAWNFGDGGTSDSRNPSHTFDGEGTYTVSLLVTNALGSDVETKTGYITLTPPGTSQAGVALTFDDDTVDRWYAARPVFQKYNAHVTFFVSNFASLDQSEIDKLKILQADGHEIAFHGLNHADEVDYIAENSLTEYLNDEIISGINLMRSEGFDPVDFAYPFGSDNPSARTALSGYFLHMRDTYYDWDDTIFYEYGSNTPYIAGIGIDDNTYGNSLSDIGAGILKAKADNRILIFYCHEPVSSSPLEYQTSYARLEYIFQTVQDNGMKTYTVAEIN